MKLNLTHLCISKNTKPLTPIFKNPIRRILQLSIVFICLLTFHQSKSQCHIDDWTALKALYESTDGDNWADNTGWEEIKGTAPTSNCNLDLLYGISKLDGAGRVEFIRLDGNGLAGSLPTELGSLSNLISLRLGYNDFIAGSIPTELGNLSNLKYLDFTRNMLTGSIPSTLGNLSNLISFEVTNNELSGGIPSELGNLSNLIILRIDGNNLAGCFPNNIYSLCGELTLNYGNDSFFGIDSGNDFDTSWDDFCKNGNGACMPFDPPIMNSNCHIDDWTALKALYESTNGDTWAINTGWEEVKGNTPAVACDLSMLNGLSLNSIGRVESLNLENYRLSGTLPTELGMMNYLKILNLTENSLDGSIPTELGNMNNLRTLALGDNNLSGSIPAELGNLSELEFLFLDNNNLSSSIPQELGNLGNLVDLILSDNQLSGSIPSALGNLTILLSLDLTNNRLTGNIPPALGNMSSLLSFRLTNNQLEGGIPAEFGDLKNLSFLRINQNNLAGCFPDNLMVLCDQFIGNYYSLDTRIYIDQGNNFEDTWEDFCQSGSGACTGGNTPVSGCTDMDAINYNANATVEDGSCQYENNTTINGCTDSNATNYNANANVDDGSCQYEHNNSDAQVFNIYSWLDGLVNQDNCNGERITVYDAGSYEFVLIQNGNEGKLYFENGTFYCNETPTYSCVEAYNLTNVAQTWSCGNNNSVSGCTDTTATNYNPQATIDDGSCQYENNNSDAQVFNTYSWLNDLVNQSNCNGESITVYDAGSYNFVLIQNGNEGKLYYQNGTFYCNETSTYSCVDAYNLNNVAQTWSCGNNPTPTIRGCTDANATNYNPDATVDDDSCQYENTGSAIFTTYSWLNNLLDQSNCNGESITVYDAGSYNFVLIQNGNEGKLYYQNGTFYCNETSTYSCVDAYNLTNVTQTWSCGNNTTPIRGCTDSNATNYNSLATEDDGSCQYENTNAQVFTTYPWLNTLVDTNNCNGESITVYDAGSYSFILIQNGNEGKLYYQNGTYYCDETLAYSCVAAYNLSNVTDSWNCGGLQNYRQAKSLVNNHIKKTTFNMYPNPTNNKVFIDLSDQSIYQVSLMDISGKVMKQMKTVLGATTLEMKVSDLPKGMYLVELKNEKSRNIQKLIIE